MSRDTGNVERLMVLPAHEAKEINQRWEGSSPMQRKTKYFPSLSRQSRDALPYSGEEDLNHELGSSNDVGFTWVSSRRFAIGGSPRDEADIHQAVANIRRREEELVWERGHRLDGIAHDASRSIDVAPSQHQLNTSPPPYLPIPPTIYISKDEHTHDHKIPRKKIGSSPRHTQLNARGPSSYFDNVPVPYPEPIASPHQTSMIRTTQNDESDVLPRRTRRAKSVHLTIFVPDLSDVSRDRYGNPKPAVEAVVENALVIDKPKYDLRVQQHQLLAPQDADKCIFVRSLGNGSLGVVDEICFEGTEQPTLVRKRIRLPAQKRIAEKIREIVREEADILGRMRHPNIATLFGSYEESANSRPSSYCLLMHPVGENDLERFLANTSEAGLDLNLKACYQSWIQSWYADLASALMYMHDNGVRHQDIKPSNIIHKGNHIFFTDFSSSGKFKVDHTTSTANPARSSAMYAAPEARIDPFSSLPRHGRALDVFGLGCVFCDMLTAQEGRAIDDFHDYLLNDGELSALQAGKLQGKLCCYRDRVPRISAWFDKSAMFINCISKMLLEERQLRPLAADVWMFCLNHGGESQLKILPSSLRRDSLPEFRAYS